MKRIYQFFFATFFHFQQLSSTDMEGESVVILIDISEVLTVNLEDGDDKELQLYKKAKEYAADNLPRGR